MAHFERATPRFIATLGDILALLTPKRHSVGQADIAVKGFEVDSRKIEKGQVFVAIKGARVDGHDYIMQAFQKGAVACLISEFPEQGSVPPNLIQVSDPVAALGYLAAAHRRSLDVKVIAITGSVGKTTTKELVYNLVAPHFYARKSIGNFNSTIGLPLQLLQLKKTDEVMVVEMGMSFPGEIRALMRIAGPDIGVWTSVKKAHLANFNSLEDIARAKAEMVEELGNDKTLIYNSDDPLVSRFTANFPGRRISYGFMNPTAQVSGQISSFSDWTGTDFYVEYSDGIRGNAHLPVPGRFNIHNALAACAVAWFMGLKHSEFTASFRRELDVSKRSQLHVYDGNIMLVDDSYNSSPYALGQVIRSFCSLGDQTYRWIVVGDMLEQGEQEIGIHRVLGHELAVSAFDRITFVGTLVKHAYETFIKYSDGTTQVDFFPNAEKAAQIANSLIPVNSRIWVKGSRSIGLERVVQTMTHRLEEEEAQQFRM